MTLQPPRASADPGRSPRDWKLHALAVLSLLLLLPACKSLTRPAGVPAKLRADEVPLALVEVRAELERGEVREAFFRARAAREAGNLPAEVKVEAESLFERATRALIDHYSEPGRDPEVLEELFDFEDISTPLAVRAGVHAAQNLYRDEKERSKAFRLIQRVDEKFPHHQERIEAGDLLAEIGFSFAADNRRYGIFFHYRDNAPGVLEYLVLNYPNQEECDRAYFTLAELYEDEQVWFDAISRHEDLVLWHPGSPLVPVSRARIPHLRLMSQASPEYDRREIELALEETEVWLARFSEADLTVGVAADRLDALQRLTDNDLIVARFYYTVENRDGAERHARRALDFARATGEARLIGDAERLLARVVAELPETLPEEGGETPVLPDPNPIDPEHMTFPGEGGG
jgi:outer membrane protein assembly factor BamD (BamD/ComL family)